MSGTDINEETIKQTSQSFYNSLKDPSRTAVELTVAWRSHLEAKNFDPADNLSARFESYVGTTEEAKAFASTLHIE